MELLLTQCQRNTAINQAVIDRIIEEDLFMHAPFRKLICHILNAEHATAVRLCDELPESELWDELPSSHWSQLNTLNRQQLEQAIHFSSESTEMSEYQVTQIIDMLAHSAYHRGQINLLLKQAKLQPVSTHLGKI